MRADFYLMALFNLCSVQQPNCKQLHSAVILLSEYIYASFNLLKYVYLRNKIFKRKRKPRFDVHYISIFIICELNIVTDIVILNKEMFDENVYMVSASCK